MMEHECIAKGVGNPKDDEEEKEGETPGSGTGSRPPDCWMSRSRGVISFPVLAGFRKIINWSQYSLF